MDEAIRFVLIPLLFLSALSSLLGYGTFLAEPGMLWFSAKILVYSLMLVLGLLLRFIMREWTVLFRRLATEGSPPEVERQLEKSIAFGRKIAYCYWVGILSVAFFAAVKPF